MALAGRRSQTPAGRSRRSRDVFRESGGPYGAVRGSNGSDTWTWNGTEWTGINDVGPEPRQATALVSAGTITILFGGIRSQLGRPLSGTWQLEGTEWTERQDIGPANRQGHAMTYDETRQQVVLFGGSAAPSATATAADLFSDTWELPSPAGSGTQTTRPPILAGFEVNPNLVQQGTPFRLDVLLDQPAPVTTSVMVTGASGSLVEEVQVAAGSTSGSSSVSLPQGFFRWATMCSPRLSTGWP